MVYIIKKFLNDLFIWIIVVIILASISFICVIIEEKYNIKIQNIIQIIGILYIIKIIMKRKNKKTKKEKIIMKTKKEKIKKIFF